MLTRKPCAALTTSAPVVNVTVRAPGSASAATVISTVTWVALTTVTFSTVMPRPKSASVRPLTKLVFTPSMVTTSVSPGSPLSGSSALMTGVPLLPLIVKPPALLTTSSLLVPAVVTVTGRTPGVASLSIVIAAARAVALVTVTLSTVMPSPKSTSVASLAKWVSLPVMATDNVAP